MKHNLIKDFLYPNEGISTQVLLNSGAGKAILYLFAQDAELKPHRANSEVLIIILEGTAIITLEGETFDAQQGTSATFKAGQMHSLRAKEQFKMLLIK